MSQRRPANKIPAESPAVPPAGRQSTVPPAGRQSTVPPAGRQPTVPPAGRQPTVPPAGRQSTVPPAGRQSAEEEPYNPFEHRGVKNPTPTFGALAHILKTSLSSGILAMPMAFKNAGLVMGVIGTVVIGVICGHCIQMLVRSSQVLCVLNRVPTLTFSETAVKAFLKGPLSAQKSAKSMGIFVTVELLGMFTLGDTVYVVLIAGSLQQVFQYFWDIDIKIQYYILSIWVPLILICLLPNLKSLVPFSVLANILVLVSFCIVIYYIVRSIHEPSSVKLVADAVRWPSFLCAVIFAIEGIGTVLSIENEMKHPQYFIGGPCGIMYIAMTTVVVVYTVIGFLGYLEYGEETEGNITLNLPIYDRMGQAVKIMIALAVYFTYALQLYVPINIVYGITKDRVQPKYHLLLQFGIRAGLVTITVILALAIPKLEIVIGIVGAIAFSTLGLMIPALIDIMTRYPNFGWCKWRLVKNILISILSVVILVSGITLNLITIIEQLKKKK